jgi:hypothetical protein
VDANEQQQQREQMTTQQQVQAAVDREKAALEYQARAAEMQHEAEMKQMDIAAADKRAAEDRDSKERIAAEERALKVLLAQIAGQQADNAEAKTAEVGADKKVAEDNGMAEILTGLKASIDKMSGPRTIIRGPDGRARGIQ